MGRCTAQSKWAWLAAACALAHAALGVTTGSAPPPPGNPAPAAGPREGHDYLVDPPDPLWRAARWPVVAALVAGNDEMAPTRDFMRKLTRQRGALLVTLAGGDESRLATVLHQVAQTWPTVPEQTLLLGRDAMGQWAWRQVLRHGGLYAGVIAIDSPVPDALDPLPGQATVTLGKACLLVTADERLDPNHRLEQALQRWGLSAAVVRVSRPQDLNLQLGAALTAELPPTPTRTEVVDPLTQAHLTAPPGWHFERRDGFLAVARPDDDASALAVEIHSGKLGRRSFDDYVDITRHALSGKWMQLLSSERLSAPDAPVLMHVFCAIDRRGDNDDRAVRWILVGNFDRLVSLRVAGPAEQLDAHAEDLRKLAAAITFDDAKAAGQP
jgi:hypothetical protein